MTYQIITESSIGQLIEQVNKEIKDGWIPLGGPVAAKIDRENLIEWVQAMIKTESELMDHSKCRICHPELR